LTVCDVVLSDHDGWICHGDPQEDWGVRPKHVPQGGAQMSPLSARHVQGAYFKYVHSFDDVSLGLALQQEEASSMEEEAPYLFTQ